MNTPSIQNKGELRRDTLSKFPKEKDNIFGNDVGLLDTPVKIKLAFCWRKSDGTDNRKVLMGDVLVKDGGFSLRRPGATEKRLKHKTRFVNEDNGPSFSFSVFLYTAISSSAKVESLPRFAIWDNAEVSDNSNLRSAESSRPKLGGR